MCPSCLLAHEADRHHARIRVAKWMNDNGLCPNCRRSIDHAREAWAFSSCDVIQHVVCP